MPGFRFDAMRIFAAIASVCVLAGTGHAQTVKWMTVGSFQSWYSSAGCEIEEGRVFAMQDGDRWPALYEKQDNIVSKGLWIGTTNYKDKDSKTYKHKVVHIGPRSHGQNEFFPMKFKAISKFPTPTVMVDGVLSMREAVDNDAIDPALKADRMIENTVNTAIGVSLTRRILGFSKEGHDNYIIFEYTFTNSGLIDEKDTRRDTVTLTDVYVYWQHRFALNADVRYVIGNSTGWGVNTMLHVVGDTTVPSTYFPASPFNADNAIRATYAWHGKYAPFTGGYDNIGGPIFVPYFSTGYTHQRGDTVGRLGSSAFIGVATLFAQKSPTEAVDDPKQPATTGYEGSDAQNNGVDPNESYNAAKMDSQYGWMTKGHVIPRHADKVGPTGDPSAGSMGGGGYSCSMGYGPYTIAPGQSITIVTVEGAAGLSREANIEIGKAYKRAPAATRDTALIPYNGTSKTKNQWVYTSRDSLFKTIKRAMANYASGYALASDVPPPPSTVTVNSGFGRISLAWTKFADDTKTVKYQVWRAIGRHDSTYSKIWEGTAMNCADSTAAFDVPHFYYVTGVDAAGTASNRYYTQSYDPAIRYRGTTNVDAMTGIPTACTLGQNYPNPFNPETTVGFSVSAHRRVELIVYDMLGRTVASLVDRDMQPGVYTVKWNARSMPSGLYFYRLRAGGFTEVKRMLLQK